MPTVPSRSPSTPMSAAPVAKSSKLLCRFRWIQNEEKVDEVRQAVMEFGGLGLPTMTLDLGLSWRWRRVLGLPWWQWIRVFELEPRPKSVMEMGALGLPMVMDSGLEKKPSPDMLMEGNVFSNKWVVVDFRVWACPWRWIWAWVGA